VTGGAAGHEHADDRERTVAWILKDFEASLGRNAREKRVATVEKAVQVDRAREERERSERYDPAERRGYGARG
jgi:hypothetical protein